MRREGEGMATWIDRVQQESDELSARIGRLSAFFDTDQFYSLPEVQRGLLVEQYCAMTKYSTLLGLRIRFGLSAPAAGGE